MQTALRYWQKLIGVAVCALLLPITAFSAEAGWSMGVYGGQYYDTEPAGILNGRANFDDQYLLALTASKTLWRSASLPMSVELDGMLGQQFGKVSLTEVAVAPVLRWSGFPWNNHVQTDVRLGPLGASYTSEVSTLERGPDGRGSQWLNFLLLELALSSPQDKSWEVFARLHHRCSIYDKLNNYGANGEDFLAFGYRRKF